LELLFFAGAVETPRHGRGIPIILRRRRNNTPPGTCETGASEFLES
jgi:hypothetical protein